MIIDFHTHIFPEKIARTTIQALEKRSNGCASTDGTAQGLIKELIRANVDIGISLPVLTKPSQFDSVAKFAITVNEQYSNQQRKIISFGGIHPKCDNIKEKLKFLKDNGIKGIKIHPDYQDTFIDDEGYIEILKCAKDLDMIVVTHAGIDDGYVGEPVKCPPELCKKVIEKVNHNKFVLGHYGGHKQWEKVLELLSEFDVCFDTAFTLHEISEDLFKKILHRHGEDKILFATDCPWRDISEDLKILYSYNLDKSVLDKILYKNATKLLGI